MNVVEPQTKVVKTNLKDYHAERQTFSWDNVQSRFLHNGLMNMTYECVDRHVNEGGGEKPALVFIEDGRRETLTYEDLKAMVDIRAAALKEHGVKKGDRVFVLLSKEPEVYACLLAAIKIGAIAGPLFEAFMEEAIRDRLTDCDASVLITGSAFVDRVPQSDLPDLEKVFLVDSDEDSGDTYSLPKALSEVNPCEEPVWVEPDDGMVIHYTSGSTGKPKGVLHAHRAMVQQYQTGHWVLDLQPDDVYWCTSHPGWVTGSSYGVFAPLLNHATIVVNSGRFDAETWYSILQNEQVSVWYTAPTALRMLKASSDVSPEMYDFTSLRHILSVGEPLNPEIFHWGHKRFGVRVHDNWWMTETGAQLVANLPSQPIKPGSMGRPLPGIEVSILGEDGRELSRGAIGKLAVKAGWPSMMKTIWKNPEKYHSYFPFPEWYISGDLAYMDEEGYVFFQGRDDDMINSAGERIGPFEVESKLLEHPAVSEAAVVGKPDPLRGEIVKGFITLNEGYRDTEELLKDIRQFVKKRLAAHAAPRELEVIGELPKTKISGKIMRRKLKARQ